MENNPSSSPESVNRLDELKAEVNSRHEYFLGSVPNFNRDVWLPYEAISSRGGSCAAEAFFVAHELIESGLVKVSYRQDRGGFLPSVLL